MIKQKIITKENGVKAEDCAVAAQAMSKYKSDVYIIKGSKRVNAKSIMGLLSLNMKLGETIYLICEGNDESAACNELYGLL